MGGGPPLMEGFPPVMGGFPPRFKGRFRLVAGIPRLIGVFEISLKFVECPLLLGYPRRFDELTARLVHILFTPRPLVIELN